MPWNDDEDNKTNGPWGQPPKNRGQNKPESSNDDFEKIINEAKEKITSIFGSGGSGGRKTPNNPGFKIIPLALAVIFILWGLSGIYTVNTKEAAVILRFGEYVRTEEPGLRYRLPTPIEKVVKLRVTDRYKTEVGYTNSSGLKKRHSNDSNIREILMLTGDENMVDVNFEVQWQIADAHKFLFNVYDPQGTVRDAAESAMREIVGTTPLNSILSEGRAKVQLDTKEMLQKILDDYDVGISIEEINMRAVPPRTAITVENITTGDKGEMKKQTITTTVDEAFKDVQAAIINKEEMINSAIARSNELIPQARGQAQRLLQEAQGYKEKAVAKAEGEANRFLSVYKEYVKAKNVTRQRIYLETMEEVLSGMDKMVIDSKQGVLPYLPLNEMKKK